MTVKPGIYRHFKGPRYRIIGCVENTETSAILVLYHSLAKPEKLWVRPLWSFTGMVEVDGDHFPRFKFIGENINEQ